ncbi:hypothetical protein KC328_g85 [Hortaea werneckii]|nr:hypothetical protein KC328_g85 [Hortaea werneckii]
MSSLICCAVEELSSISRFRPSICRLYSSNAVQISSLKSSITMKSGKKGIKSSIRKFLPERVVYSWGICDFRGKLDVIVTQREVDSSSVLPHTGVHMHGALHTLMGDAETKGKVGIVILLACLRLSLKIAKQSRFVFGRVRGVEGDESVMDGRLGSVSVVNAEQKVSDRLCCRRRHEPSAQLNTGKTSPARFASSAQPWLHSIALAAPKQEFFFSAVAPNNLVNRLPVQVGLILASKVLVFFAYLGEEFLHFRTIARLTVCAKVCFRRNRVVQLIQLRHEKFD